MRGLDEEKDIIDDIPLLLIDDECDNASVTKTFKEKTWK